MKRIATTLALMCIVTLMPTVSIGLAQIPFVNCTKGCNQYKYLYGSTNGTVEEYSTWRAYDSYKAVAPAGTLNNDLVNYSVTVWKVGSPKCEKAAGVPLITETCEGTMSGITPITFGPFTNRKKCVVGGDGGY